MAYNHYKRFSKNKASEGNKSPYSELNPHTLESPIMKNDNIIITSIDPGIVNCGIYTCAYNTTDKTHKSIFLKKLSFNKGNNHFLESLSEFETLENEKKLFSSSHYIIIEAQMSVNYDLVRMGQHLISYLLLKVKDQGNRPLIIEISPQCKTKSFSDYPKGLSKYQYKKWCTAKALELLQQRDLESEKDFIYILKHSRKSDDMGDTIAQYYAWISYIESEYNRPSLPIKKY